LSYLGALARCTSVAFSRDGKQIAACDDREVTVHDLHDKKPVWTEHFEMEVAPEQPQTTSAANGPTAASGDAARKASADRAPTLAEIAKANDAAWAAIRSMDVEYTRTERIVSEKRPRQSESTGRWLKDGNRERVRQNSVFTCQLEDGKTSSGRFDYDDYCLDGTAVRHVQERDRKRSDRGTLSIVDPKPRDDLVGYIYKGPRTVARGDCPISEPEVLRYFRCRYDDPPLTLAEIIAAWKVTLQGKTTTDAKETLWRLHAEFPVRSDAPSEADGSYIDFYVNAGKGFMVQKAIAYVTHEYLIDKKSLNGCHSVEVKEFQPCGDGVFFPKRVEYRKQIGVEQISADPSDCLTFVATKLSVNSPLAGDAFDFRFPAGLEVGERDKNNRMGEGEKVYIWGPDNKPAQTFASERDYLKLQYARHFEETRQKVEKNLASKKPKDLAERVEYYMSTRKYGEAVVACSQWIAAGTTRQEKANVVCRRGMAYLLKQDYEKAIVDFNEVLRLVEKPGDEEGVCLYRALAYAGQDGTLDKAMNDLAKIEDISPGGPDDFNCCWASLLRAAARIRRLHTAGAVKDKAQAQRDVATIMNDIQQAMNVWPSPEAVALMACFIDQDKSSSAHAYVASLREVVKREPKKEFPLDDGTLLVDIDAAVCKCLMRLVPEIEKELKAMRKGESPKS
jgi:tetratricopeptide (TPR) repeat protein